jgi:regulator of protease activity HflC (stomatin/prohibitin superfamily)
MFLLNSAPRGWYTTGTEDICLGLSNYKTCLFSVPPQQFITCDGGIVEIGAEVQFGIVDIVTMVKEVADHQDILR